MTSQPYTSSFNGVLNLDNHCAFVAVEAELVPPDIEPLDFVVKAWVSSATEWPAKDFAHHEGRYVLLGDDAPVIAESWVDLVSGQLLHAIDRNEFGEQVQYDDVITNTKPDGTPASNIPEEMCDTWTWDNMSLPIPVVSYGEPDRADGGWTQQGIRACDGTRRLYCFQQKR